MFNKKKKFIISVLTILFTILFMVNAYNQRKQMLTLYNSGKEKINNEEYQEAQEILGKLGDYKDSFEQIKDAQALQKKKEIY